MNEMKRKSVPGPTFDVLEDARTMVEKLRQLPREKLMYIKGSIDMAALPDEPKPEAAHNQKPA